jgi:hypothetical protein
MKIKDSDFLGKSIILFVPNDFDLPNVFRKNLEFIGFKVFLLPVPKKNKLFFGTKIIHFIKKTLLGDKTYKSMKLAEQIREIQIDFLENVSHKIDYALVIRPDYLCESVLRLLSNKVNLSVAYQWDGMQRFPRTKTLIKHFHRFYVFDEIDEKNHPETTHISNFYFDYLPNKQENRNDIFFVGTYMKDRIHQIVCLSKKFSELNLKTNINLIYKKRKHIRQYKNYNINFRTSGINFDDAIKEIISSKIVLDFQNSVHNGLSFRTFEALGYQKKLITNNPLVKKYNFFHPNNIFVIINNDLSGIEEFLNSDYVSIPRNIIEQYSFTNWINKVLTND